MRKIIAFCMVTILILSSGCIGWADNKPSISSSGEPVSQELPIIPIVRANVSDQSVTSTTEKSIEKELPKDPIKPGDPVLPPEEPPLEPPVTPNDKMRLLVWPSQIDLSLLSSNEYFSKNIRINNPNALSTNVVITFKSKEKIKNISVSPANLTIAANGSSNITISGITPSPSNFKAELEISNSLNNYTETCSIYATGSQAVPETQMPLSISPKEIDLSSSLPYESFSKLISIYNPNSKSSKLSLMFKDKENFDDIIVDKEDLTISANSTSYVKVSGRVPSAANYKATLEIVNNLNNHTATCLIQGQSSISGPKNVKVAYDSTSEDYTITWDPMTGDIDHYIIYVWNYNKWDLWVEVSEPKYVRHYIALEVAKDLRVMITGVDSQGNSSRGTEARWIYDENEGPISPPRNVRITYNFDSKLHSIFWDPPKSGTVLKYKVEYSDFSTGEMQLIKNYTTNTNFGIVGRPVSQGFGIYAKSTSGVYSDRVWVHCIPAVRKIECLYDSEKEELKLMWKRPADYVFRFKVYSSYNDGTYFFEEQLGSLDSPNVENFTYIKKGVKADEVTKYKFKIRSLQTHAGEEREINLKDFSLTDKNLVSTKRIDAHINIHDNTADISWSEIPGAKSYKVYGAINGGNYSLLRVITGKTEYVLSSPPPYDPPRDIEMKIKVKGTGVYAWNQKDVIETVTFSNDPIHPGRP